MAKKQEQKHMSQVIHWALFLAVGLTSVLKITEASAKASYELILINPEIAGFSSLVTGLL